MSYLKATYTLKDTSDVIQVPLDLDRPLTDSIVNLQEQINTYLTKNLAGEIQLPVSTVEQDERDQELQEMQEDEDEEELSNDVKMEYRKEDGDSCQQSIKKQRTDL